MRPDLIPTQEEFNAMDKSVQIDTLCTVHECKEKKKKIHHKQYVFEKWNPHPPQRFLRWWNKDGIAQTENATGREWKIDAIRAFNCEAVREVYTQAKESELA